MTLTTTKSWKNYITLCNALKRNDIDYEKDDKHLCIKCSVSGRDIEQNFLFEINPSKMLITLFSPVPLTFGKEKTADMSLAVCMINNSIADGSFCIDIKDRLLYFKMTASFYESTVNDTVFEYMLSTAANTVDEYYPKLHRLAKSGEPYSDSDSSRELSDYLKDLTAEYS
ncbi:MAG: hypothetical protein IJ861_03575 [Clostridia bacterium]|nr:hypothetical protein [Clostridia bacterium]